MKQDMTCNCLTALARALHHVYGREMTRQQEHSIVRKPCELGILRTHDVENMREQVNRRKKASPDMLQTEVLNTWKKPVGAWHVSYPAL